MKEQKNSLLFWISLAVVFLAVAAALPSFALVFGLPIEGDAMDYRVPMIQWMIRHGQYPNWPWSTVEDPPMLGELAMTFFYWLNPHLMRLVPLLAYLGTGWVAFDFCKILRPNMPALVGAAWILGLRPLALQSNVLMVDNVASFLTLASLLFLCKLEARKAGIFCALALASRYTAWCYTPALLSAAIILYRPSRQVRPILEFVGVSALGALPNMARNYIANDNPIFPFLTSVFNKVTIDVSSRGFFEGIGRGKSFTDFLLLPYDMLYTNSFVRGFFDYTVGKLFYLQLFALVVALAWWLVKKRPGNFFSGNFSRIAVALAAFAFVHLLVWFFSSQQMRYLVPFMVLLNIGILVLLWDLHTPLLLLLVTACVAFSIVSIQRDSILIAFGKKESPFAEEGRRAIKCFQNPLVHDKLVAFIARDGALAYLDRDFVFFAPNGYATPLEYFPQAPEIVYYPEPIPSLEGKYEVLPGGEGCFLRRKSGV